MQCGDPPRLERLQDIRGKSKRSDTQTTGIRRLAYQPWARRPAVKVQHGSREMLCDGHRASKAIAQTNNNLHSMCLRATKRSIPLIITRKKADRIRASTSTERNQNTRNM